MASPGASDGLSSAAIIPLPSSLSAAGALDGASSRPTSSAFTEPTRSTTEDGGRLHDEEPMFMVEKVKMQFQLASDFVAAGVANNVLVLALQTGRIMRIDLDAPDEIDDIDLPRKSNEVGIIRKLFIDPTASHLIITTTGGENFYLHSQNRQPKALSRLKGLSIECVSWNPSQPTASTREILLGTTDGQVFETYIDSTTEFYRREERYAKAVFRTQGPITGLWTDALPGKPDLRRVIIATPSRLIHFFGRYGRHGHEGSGSIFIKLFEGNAPTVHDASAGGNTASVFAVTPEAPEARGNDGSGLDRIFAWSGTSGVSHGRLLTQPTGADLGERIFNEMKILSPSLATFRSRNRPSSEGNAFIALTQWHILQLVDNRVVAFNRLDDSLVFDQSVLEPGHRPLALVADPKKNTFWLFTSREIFEIEVQNEDRDIWRVLLKGQKFEEALQYANSSIQKDKIASSYGDYLIEKAQFMEAASIYGRSSKSFEQVALRFIDQGQRDALRKYLLTKLATLGKSSVMQRTMVAAWLTEIFMAKLNSLDDMVMTGAELSEEQTATDARAQLSSVREEFQEFVRVYKSDLDRKTSYDIMSSHGREDELLFFAAAMDDYNYVLAYWVQRENWSEGLKALSKQTDKDIIYKYSSVLMTHASVQLVDILMRQPGLDARKIIPALLNYNQTAQAPISQNQAIRYLAFEITHRGSTDSAVHNTLLSLYASHPTKDESALLGYLESQSSPLITTSRFEALANLPYDADFALRLCIQHSRIRSCVHIYMTMGQYSSAVELALENSEIDLAISVADRAEHHQITRKKLWLSIARAVIASPSTATHSTALKSAQKSSQPKGLAPKSTSKDATPISLALSLIHRAQPPGTLRIEDLLPLLPSFLQIDTLKEEITSALASYTASIKNLRAEMDASAATSARIDADIAALKQRWVLVQPGESCAVCGQVLVDRRFWVWSCGHGAHADCVRDLLGSRGSKVVKRRIKELRAVLEGPVGSTASNTAMPGTNSLLMAATTNAPVSAAAASAGIAAGAARAQGPSVSESTAGGVVSGDSAATVAAAAPGTGLGAGAGAGGRKNKETARKELNELCGAECPLCGDLAIRSLDEPFISSIDNVAEWAL